MWSSQKALRKGKGGSQVNKQFQNGLIRAARGARARAREASRGATAGAERFRADRALEGGLKPCPENAGPGRAAPGRRSFSRILSSPAANFRRKRYRGGSVRRGVRPGAPAARAFRSAGGPAAPLPGVWELPSSRGTAPNCRPEAGGGLFGERVFAGSKNCVTFKDFSETFVSVMLSFVCVGF